MDDLHNFGHALKCSEKSIVHFINILHSGTARQSYFKNNIQKQKQKQWSLSLKILQDDFALLISDGFDNVLYLLQS